MKKIFRVFAVLAAFGVWFAPLALANYQINYHTYDIWGLEHKFLKKAYFIMDHKAEIAVQASQIEKIKNLQVEVKKEIMRQGGELDALTYELMSHLDRFEVDSKPLQELVDRRYKLQLNLDRFLVNSFIELRNILDETQYAKYKELWERYYKG